MGKFDDLRALALISLRSLLRHRAKSLIVGGILTTGTFILVVGGSLLDNVERAMERSITGSLIGNLQVFSAAAKDELTFYGPAAGSQQDVGTIPDFSRVNEALSVIPHVVAVIPMGRDVASAVGGNELDELLGELREAVRREDGPAIEAKAARTRQVAGLMHDQYEKKLALARDPAVLRPGLELLAHVSSAEFWEEFAREPIPALELLDQQLAPLEADPPRVFLPYIGTDIERYAQAFEGFEIVDGQLIPPGQRGFLFNKGFYDEQLKNRVALALDQIREARDEDGRRIATDEALKALVAKTARATRRITYELDPAAAGAVERELRKLLPGVEGDLPTLLSTFLQLDDSNFDARYAFFYEVIAPRIRLYKVEVGETLTVRAFTRGGYLKAQNLKVWGTFRFQGLEDSFVASRYNLMDLISFRELYGLMTPEKRRELDEIKAHVGVRELSREDAEAALFGEEAPAGPPPTAPAAPTASAAPAMPAAPVAPAARAPPDEPAVVQAEPAPPDAPFTREQLEHGVVLNAAVLLDDPARLEEVRREIERRSAEQGLGIQVLDWQEVSGIVGQFILVMRAVLYTAILIIFGVALVIINNSMLMATLDRVQEIGTMRAIGAQRGFVLAMFLLETLALGALAGAVGSGLAAILIGILGEVGIPASHRVAVVLFGGDVLYPTLRAGSVLTGLGAIFVVSLASTLYPAWLATRIPPVVAMQAPR